MAATDLRHELKRIAFGLILVLGTFMLASLGDTDPVEPQSANVTSEPVHVPADALSRTPEAVPEEAAPIGG